MTDLGALLFSIWVTANICAIFYCVRSEWPVSRALGRNCRPVVRRRLFNTPR
jgi:hypothetical protein